MKPICFVIMPFGTKEEINFNKIYENIIKPAIEKAGMIPFREDEEINGGIIHKTMIEKIIFSDFVIADISIENANVYYELGIRHMASKKNTLLISCKDIKLFDIKLIRHYRYNKDSLNEVNKIVKRIKQIQKDNKVDSPIYDFFDFTINIEQLKEKANSFKKEIDKISKIENKIYLYKKENNLKKLQKLETKLLNNKYLLKTLFIAYRDLEKYDKMIKLYKIFPNELQNQEFIMQQYGFALNRIGKRNEAEIVLQKTIQKYGKSSETLGILGRVYKDWWLDTNKKEYLKKAIKIYKEGFEADIRDFYPGINLVTLLLQDDNQKEFKKYLPVVDIAVELAVKNKDYWSLATKLEISFLKQDCKQSKRIINEILVVEKPSWMIKTTIKNLELILNKLKNNCLKQSLDKLRDMI